MSIDQDSTSSVPLVNLGKNETVVRTDDGFSTATGEDKLLGDTLTSQ